MQISCLEVFGDSQLIVKQINGEYALRHESLVPYFERSKHLMSKIQDVVVNHIPRAENDKADALAKLAASLTFPDERNVQIMVGERRLLSPALERAENEDELQSYLITIQENTEELDWRQPLIDYLQHGVLPLDPRSKVDVRKRALRFVFLNDTLYKPSFDGVSIKRRSFSCPPRKPCRDMWRTSIWSKTCCSDKGTS